MGPAEGKHAKKPKADAMAPYDDQVVYPLEDAVHFLLHSFRSSGVVKLPSERTLRDYTNVIDAKAGFQREVDEQLVREANITSEHEKYVALIFDEVKVKEDLVYNKHSGELVGFVNITDINQHSTALERACSTEDEHIPQLATHMLVFMVRGICSSLKFAYAQFPVRTASGEILHPIVWECVEHLEMVGLKVLALSLMVHHETESFIACTNRRGVVLQFTRSTTYMQMLKGPYF